jgi:AcrR family transcriptional regulator
MTSPTSRRERQREQIRARILDTALELFAAQGYEATSVDQIADRADLARRTVFNHFPRKRDMLAAWAVDRRALTAALLDDDHVRRTPARQQLELQIETLARANEENPQLARALALGWLAEMAAFDTPFPVFDSFTDSVRLGQERGEFQDSVPPETVAELLSSCYMDTLHRWLLTDGVPALLPALRAKLSVVLDGLVTDSGQ